MSRLKILDLSFCETELQNERSVQGGMFGYASVTSEPGYFKYDVAPLDSGFHKKDLYDPETGATGIMIYNPTMDTLTVVGALKNSEDGENQFEYKSNFSYSARIQ